LNVLIGDYTKVAKYLRSLQNLIDFSSKWSASYSYYSYTELMVVLSVCSCMCFC